MKSRFAKILERVIRTFSIMKTPLLPIPPTYENAEAIHKFRSKRILEKVIASIPYGR